MRPPSPRCFVQTDKGPQDFHNSAGSDLLTLRLNHFAAAQTGSADAYVLGGGSHPGMNRAQIDVPAPLTHVVGVADGISELRPLAADITNSCHNSQILPRLLPKRRFYRNPADFAKPMCVGTTIMGQFWNRGPCTQFTACFSALASL